MLERLANQLGKIYKRFFFDYCWLVRYNLHDSVFCCLVCFGSAGRYVALRNDFFVVVGIARERWGKAALAWMCCLYCPHARGEEERG